MKSTFVHIKGTAMNIEIKLHEICVGSETISLRFGDTVIHYDLTYMGPEALSTLIDSVISLGYEETINIDTERFRTTWETEPGTLKLSFYRNKITNRTLLKTESDSESLNGLEIEFDFNEYKEAVIKESLRVLKLYGLRGFNASWADGMDVFPINSLLALLGADIDYHEKTFECSSNIFTELDILKAALIKQE